MGRPRERFAIRSQRRVTELPHGSATPSACCEAMRPSLQVAQATVAASTPRAQGKTLMFVFERALFGVDERDQFKVFPPHPAAYEAHAIASHGQVRCHDGRLWRHFLGFGQVSRDLDTRPLFDQPSKKPRGKRHGFPRHFEDKMSDSQILHSKKAVPNPPHKYKLGSGSGPVTVVLRWSRQGHRLCASGGASARRVG